MTPARLAPTVLTTTELTTTVLTTAVLTAPVGAVTVRTASRHLRLFLVGPAMRRCFCQWPGRDRNTSASSYPNCAFGQP